MVRAHPCGRPSGILQQYPGCRAEMKYPREAPVVDNEGISQTLSGEQEQEQPRVIRILLADDHALVREGTRRLLETESDVEVVGEAASGEEAIEAARRLRPDIAIIDIAMPGIGGIEATRAIKIHCPGTAVLILSAYDD